MFIFTFIFYQFYQLETLWKDKQLLRSGRKLLVIWQYLPTLYTYLPFTLRSGRKLSVTWQYLPTLYTYLPFTLRSGRKLSVTWQYLPTLYTYLPFTRTNLFLLNCINNKYYAFNTTMIHDWSSINVVCVLPGVLKWLMKYHCMKVFVMFYNDVMSLNEIVLH
jgi:hypothetical protein